MRYGLICTIDRSGGVIKGSVDSATIDRSRYDIGLWVCGWGRTDWHGPSFIIASNVRVLWAFYGKVFSASIDR